MLNEELLEAWLRLSCVIDNQRLAADFPFNEALVCGLLSQGGCRTELISVSILRQVLSGGGGRRWGRLGSF